MKKIKVGAITGALAGVGLIAAPAQAEVFVGATVGQSDIGAYEFGSDTVVKNDDSDTAFHVFAGWQASDYLAVSLGYADLGTLSVAGSYDGGEGAISYTDDIDATAIDLSLIGILPLGQSSGGGGLLSKVYLFAQLGVAQVEQDIRYVEDGFTWTGSDDGTNMVYGFGVGIKPSENFGIHLRWVDYGDIGSRSSATSGHEQGWSAWGAGFTWSFGN